MNAEQQLKKMPEYIIITPMRNEVSTIRVTIEAVLNQTHPPKLWIILGDGSTDGSYSIVEEYLEENSWLQLVKIEDRGFDFVGQGVAQLLNKGLELVKEVSSDYLVKLDADLNLPNEYFKKLITTMEANENLGLISGHPYIFENNKKTFERHSSYFPAGPARVYRRSFLNDIGPFVNSVGWDTVDILRMRVKGYGTSIDSELPFHHMRPMGTRIGYKDGMVRDGRNAYLTGYHPLFFICRALFNAKNKPYILRSCCMLWGFFITMLRRPARVVSQEELQYHRSLQMKRLLFKPLEK